MGYRREIDGLRAVAVIPVILFHAGFDVFAGGFVGVDVFFVISGYLITTIILTEQERGEFSLIRFYERRARRILPALFLVMLASLPFAWFWLNPKDLRDFSQSVVAVSAFLSNVLFWTETGYFETASELKPLLHTWSLALEEQYYVLIPLMLMALWFLRKRWILAAIIAVGVISLLYAQWGSQNHPKATFFLLPTRAWELMMGATVAFLILYPRTKLRSALSSASVPEWLGLTGISLILVSVFTFDEALPFPSFYALIPTIGTALIILFATSETVVGRALGHRYLVGIGLVSYSAYLWHQPLFSFVRYRSLTSPSGLVLLMLSVLAIALAYFSWRYVEMPFRRKGVVRRRTVFAAAAIGSVAFASIGLAGHLSNGFGHRVNSSGVPLSDLDYRIRPNWGLSASCDGSLASPDCRTSDAPEVMVWGDSYAMHLVSGILASNPAASLIQMTKSACGPILGIAPTNNNYPVPWANECLAFADGVFDWLRENDSVTHVVLSSPFFQYLTGDWNVVAGGSVREASVEFAEQRFRSTLERIRGLGVEPVIFSPLPGNGVNIGACLARAARFSLDLGVCNFPLDALDERSEVARDFLARLETDYRVVRFDDVICPGGLCTPHIGSAFVYQDDEHFSHEGSAAVGKEMNFYRLITGR